ncbi:MAG: GvpL/GvpF family gas vesicle protein [Bacillota bacterium]
MTGKYAYGIIDTGISKVFEISGIEGAAIFTVPVKEFAMVASDVSYDLIVPGKDNMLVHQKVIREVMHEHTILPMAFGTIFKDVEALKNLILDHYEELETDFTRLSKKIELGLKVFWTKESIITDLEALNQEIRKRKEEIVAMPSQQDAYYGTIELGRMVEAAADEKRSYYAEQIYHPLQKFAVEAKLGKLIGERMILNASFLIEREREAFFDEQVNRICAAFTEHLIFKYTGPWPPYNFVGFQITKG